MDFIENILIFGKTQPERAAIVLAEGHHINWRQLCSGIHEAQARLSRHQITANDLVSLEIADPAQHILLFCALMRSGICTINSGYEVSRQAADLGANVFLCGAEGLPPDFNLPAGARILTVGDDWFMPAGDPGELSLPIAFKPGLPAVVFFTSGTTGEPQPNAKSATQYHTRVMIQREQMDIVPWSRILIIPDMLSSFGLNCACAALFSGRTVFIIKTALAAKAIELYRIDFIAATPYILYALVETMKRHQLSAHTVRGIRVAGSGIGESLMQDISQRLSPNVSYGYSSVEAGAVTILPLPVTGREPGFAGQVLPDVSVRIIDSSGTDVTPGDTGEILIRSPATSLPFKNKDTPVEAGADVWVRPGDVGRFDYEGNLVVTGRVSDIINIGGAKMRPELLEEFLVKQPGIREAAVISIPPHTSKIEEVHIFVTGDDLDAEILRQEWQDALGLVRPQKVHLLPAIPRNRLGKIARAELRALARHS